MDILQRLEEYAATRGDRIAFRSRSGEISYAELWDASGRLAGRIEKDMMGDRRPVVVYGHKDPMMIVCFIACVRSGRAYCPLDTSMPQDRISLVAEIIGSPMVLLAENGDESAAPVDFGNGSHIMGYDDIIECAELPQESEAADLKPCSGEDNYYIIFTSGTTGKPKGVQITSDNLNNYLSWAVSLNGGIEEGSVFLNQAPYCFDLSVMDLYLSLATGGTIVAVDSSLQKDVAQLVEYLSGQNINYWVSTPSFIELCLADESFNGSALDGLRAFLFCGEVLFNETALALMKRFPRCNVINTYGPTESTVCITEVRITEDMARGDAALPVGRIKPGTHVKLDPETSEIIIIGDTVSPGYYKAPELTSKSFFTFSEEDSAPDGCSPNGLDGLQAYRTGDSGYFDENGMLCCEGRIDNQIKLHGYRIEIEDIEANLMRLDGVRRAAVSPLYRSGKAESMTAFVVRNGNDIEEGYAGRRAVRIELRKLMPSYMVPKKIVFLDSLPMTGNGKLDRKKLREMA